MSTAILTPFDFTEPVKAGRRRFWKQLLPVTSIKYKGREVNFDESYHQDLELAFNDGAYDQVPVVFADANNQHNEDPRNFAGELLAVENRGADGTWGLIEADKDGAKAINKNPKLGVSARIIEGIQKADGRAFNRAIRHVCLTMNPRVQGMSPWQAVDLSESATTEVVDLTTQEYKEGTIVARKTTKERRQVDLSALDDEQFATLIDLATSAGVLEADVDDEVDDEVDEDEEVEEEPRRKPRRKKSKTKITVEKDSEDDGDPDDEEEVDDEEDDDETDLTEVPRRRKSRVTRTTKTPSRLRKMELDLAEDRWLTDRDKYLKAGVPPFMLDLAGPILSSPDEHLIDLSDGDDPVDAAATIRQMLDGLKGTIDLTGVELGSSIDLSDAHVEKDEDDVFIKAWEAQYS